MPTCTGSALSSRTQVHDSAHSLCTQVHVDRQCKPTVHICRSHKFLSAVHPSSRQVHASARHHTMHCIHFRCSFRSAMTNLMRFTVSVGRVGACVYISARQQCTLAVHSIAHWQCTQLHSGSALVSTSAVHTQVHVGSSLKCPLAVCTQMHYGSTCSLCPYSKVVYSNVVHVSSALQFPLVVHRSACQ